MASAKKLFVLIAVKDPTLMDSKLAAEFPEAFLKVADGEWFLVAESTSTTKEISHKLKITNESNELPEGFPGAAIILSVTNYYGRASNEVWEWIGAKLGGLDAVAG